LKRSIVIPVIFLVLYNAAYAQLVGVSVATDLGLQFSLKKEQRYTAVGQTTQMHFHFTPADGAYFLISYYTAGNFNNKLNATAKFPATTPQEIAFINKAKMRFKQLSLGWKHYLKGNFDNEETWNLYGYAGFGLLLGRIDNTHSPSINTSLYEIPVRSGKGNFKRLTLDLGLGWETNLGGALFFYNEARVWIPTTDYPSAFLFVNRKAPLVATISAGIRILFD
jgi:hypothetical protein